MARILNVEQVLGSITQPDGKGEYTIYVQDRFLSENTGYYTVKFYDGKALSVNKLNSTNADLSVSVETLCQLAIGIIDLDGARYRKDTVIYSNENTLQKLFTKKLICAI
jgi:predicted acetyltransferase